jgi:hypothetical protein
MRPISQSVVDDHTAHTGWERKAHRALRGGTLSSAVVIVATSRESRVVRVPAVAVAGPRGAPIHPNHATSPILSS